MIIQDRLTQTRCVTVGKLQGLSGAPCVGRAPVCDAEVLQTGLALICSFALGWAPSGGLCGAPPPPAV